MKWLSTALILAAFTFIGIPASAQEMGPGPGTVEVTLIPGGGFFFVGGDVEHGFGNYNFGGSVTYNMTRYVGLEGEVGATVGINQALTMPSYRPLMDGSTTIGLDARPPDMLTYMGNLVFSDLTYGRRLVPYGTIGIGGLTLDKRADLGINATETFLTGNVGAGVKWFATSRVGFRGDYRFIMVGSKSNSPLFFGNEDRFGHRFYGALIINAVK